MELESFEPAHVDDLAEELAELIRAGLRSNSRWSLDTAMRAKNQDGVAGVLTIKIPPRSKDFADVHFVFGTVDVIHRFDGGQ